LSVEKNQLLLGIAPIVAVVSLRTLVPARIVIRSLKSK